MRSVEYVRGWSDGHSLRPKQSDDKEYLRGYEDGAAYADACERMHGG